MHLFTTKMKIYNPYRKVEGYNCFGCSPDNPIGLRLNFREEADEVVADWVPSKPYEGWMNVLHGGIQATLLDEIASWVVFVKMKTAGVTRQMDVRYRKPVLVSDGAITIRAQLREINHTMAVIDAKLFSGGKLCSEAVVTYYIFGEDEARDKFLYPGSDAFYSQT
jgi:acyl-coenzyme A thioesterase PaaI-like protein